MNSFGAAPAIGIATASGHFTVEKSQVWGNSTLFEGATVETQQASSELALRNGVKLQLGAMSRAKIWENRLALERGVGQAFGSAAFELDAAGLKIHSADGAGRFRVALNDRLEVTTLAGVARVTNSSGAVLASIPAGRAMTFAMQQGAATGAITRTGCLMYKDGHFILQDDNTQEVVELNGVDAAARALQANTGNRVEVIGTAGSTKPAVTIATSLLNVATVTAKSQGGCLSAAAGLNAQTEAPASSGAGKAAATGAAAGAATGAAVGAAAGAAAGISTGAIVGIVAGGAGAATAAALVLTKGKSSTSQ